MEKIGKSPERYPELDYLRGVACLLVVVFHFLSRGPKANWTGGASFPLLESVAHFGFFGVHLFFMISGFVIYKSAVGRTVKQFAIARFWRLYPAYWIAILVTTLFILVFNAKVFAVSLPHFLLNFTMLQEFVRAESVDGAYWSLEVELIFYVHIGLAIAFGYVSKLHWLVAAMLSVSILNFFLKSGALNLFLIAQWAPYFAIGMLVSKIREGDRAWQTRALFVLAVLAACMRTFDDSMRIENREFLPDLCVVLAIIVLFFVIVGKRRMMKESFASGVFGSLTYPLYLLHQNIGYIIMAAVVNYVGSSASFWIAFVSVVAMSVVVNEVIEKRLVKFIRRSAAAKTGILVK
jgi:peptidoglycan/LPS O-acetylase OafA/YrhL